MDLGLIVIVVSTIAFFWSLTKHQVVSPFALFGVCTGMLLVGVGRDKLLVYGVEI